jgi:methyl-accepting chemotaxis protein
LKGFIITGEGKYTSMFTESQKSINEYLDLALNILENSKNPADILKAKELKQLIQEEYNYLQNNYNLVKSGNTKAVIETFKAGKGDQIRDKIENFNSEREKSDKENKLKNTSEINSLSGQTKYTIIISIIISVILFSVIGYFITTSISKPLKELTAVSENIADGDLRISIRKEYQEKTDEIGTLSKTYVKMILSLNNIINEITEAVNVMIVASNQISSTTSQLSASSTETAASVSETTTTVEEVKQTTLLSTKKAEQVSDNAQKTEEVSREGEKAINDTIININNINEQMNLISETIVKLAEQSRTIGTIITSVGDLAEQSNLLAVNAAIEAAKAGEHGKGFTVVAQEIKSLAEQSKHSTMQIRTILNDIQNGINNAVLSAEKGSKVVETGKKQSVIAGDSMKKLSDIISESAHYGVQISTTSKQQYVGMEQVAAAMGNIKTASTQNAESTRQLEAAAKNLKDLSSKLKNIVEHFKV